jgi:hypothetical protein
MREDISRYLLIIFIRSTQERGRKKMENPNKLEEKGYTKIDKGNESMFFSADGGNYFGIAFDKIFKLKPIGVYNVFEMSSKRNFRNLTNTILETYQELFLDKKGKFKEDYAVILFDMLNMKSKLMVEETSYDMFLAMLDKITDSNKKLLLGIVNDFVEEHYALELDKITDETREKKKKVNEELQFSDAHAKNLLKISYLFRVMIPIISVYFTYNKSQFAKNEEEAQSEEFEDLQFDEINASIFGHLFEKMMEPKTTKSDDKSMKKPANALRNKLYKLTYSRVSKTSYSDKRFWMTAKNQGITKDTVTLDIYKKLLINAIPKLSIDGDRNIVSFLSSVINNQIDFLFQNKFKYKYTSLGDVSEKYSDEDDDSSEYERLEIQMLRKDEGLYILRKLSIDKVIKTIPEKFGVTVTDKEVKSEVIHANRHSIQEKIVAMLTFKYFRDKSAIKFLSFYQYTYLVIAARKYLVNHKFTLLPQILTAHCNKHKERTGISGKRIRPLIQDSKKYKELFESKFNSFAEDIEKPLSSIIGTTYSSVFTDHDGKELFDSTVKVGKVADELLDLAFLI